MRRLLAATVTAQFHLPKVPSIKKPEIVKQPDAVRKANYCDGITSDEIEKFLNALSAEQIAVDRELAAATAKKAEVDRAQQARGQRMVTDMIALSDCKDPKKEKDPRTREADRLQKLADDAAARGDDKKSDEYQRQASALSDEVDIDADRACGGKGSALFADCKAKFIAADSRTAEAERLRRQAAEAAKHGDKKTSDELTAQAAQLIAMRDVDAVRQVPAGDDGGADGRWRPGGKRREQRRIERHTKCAREGAQGGRGEKRLHRGRVRAAQGMYLGPAGGGQCSADGRDLGEGHRLPQG